MRDDTLYLKDILAAMDSIEAFVAGMDLKAFQADDKTASAVIRKFEIIGEATKQIPEDIRRKYPQVPWKEATIAQVKRRKPMPSVSAASSTGTASTASISFSTSAWRTGPTVPSPGS